MKAASPALDPVAVAGELGITVAKTDSSTWRVGSTLTTVIYATHADQRVCDARIWEGIAQCLLTRQGVPWCEDDAIVLAAELKVSAEKKH
jgi:hypothetical protein